MGKHGVMPAEGGPPYKTYYVHYVQLLPNDMGQCGAISLGTNRDMPTLCQTRVLGHFCCFPDFQPFRVVLGVVWVTRAANMVSPYFEGADSISGLGLPQSQPFRGTGLKTLSWKTDSRLLFMVCRRSNTGNHEVE